MTMVVSLEVLRRPMPLGLIAAVATAVAIAVALYCLLYTWLSGSRESPGEAIAWAFANVLPWLLAIEAAKRSRNWSGAVAWLLVALIASVVAGYLLRVSADGVGFEVARRLPAIMLSAALVGFLRSGIWGGGPAGTMPLLPSQIDWVRAAGNYVEIRSRGRTIVHRLSLGSAEQQLAPHGFVRIHRSTLVSRDRISRVRPLDVVLDDGTQLKVGKRYRSQLPG